MKSRPLFSGITALLNSIKNIACDLGVNLKLHSRHLFILAIASSLIIAYTATISGCTASGQQTKDTGHTHSAPKFNGHHRDVQ